MKPKIFVSSTYYDMKYIRENIEKLLFDLGFDSILFESGDVTFEHDEPLESSCYKEVRNLNMLILIVGGRYGAESTTMGLDEYSRKYEKYYTSITKNEFLTARERGIPIYAFVESNVLTEYETFKKNRDLYYNLEQENKYKKITFAYVDNVNVFEFISDLYIAGLPIFRFSKYEDIENQFKSQISGLLYLYLDSLVNRKTDSKVSESVDNMKNLIERMEKMVQKVGEKVLENDQEVLATIEREQKKSIIDFCITKLANRITIIEGTENDESAWLGLSEILMKEYFLKIEQSEYHQKKYIKKVFLKYKSLQEDVKKDAEEFLSRYKIKLLSIDFEAMEEMSKEIVEFSKLNPENYEYVIKKFATELRNNWFPF